MKIWLAAAIAVVGLKLFTYEYHLADDPTCGLAARWRPSLSNQLVLRPGDAVLLTDENDYPGSGLYRALVNWGYLAVVAGLAVVLVKRRRSPSRPR